MNAHPPAIGDWYSLRGGELFEVVAVDDTDGTIEVQYFDGTLEEMDREDWQAQYSAGEIEEVDAPEDWSGSVDVEPEDDGRSGNVHDDRRLNALSADGLDLFE
jgi:DNA/RNA endonuclease YhcR with UshA esterase domain